MVKLIPAPRGAGIVAARVPKKVLQMAGIDDCYTCSRGSTKTLGNFVKVLATCKMLCMAVPVNLDKGAGAWRQGMQQCCWSCLIAGSHAWSRRSAGSQGPLVALQTFRTCMVFPAAAITAPCWICEQLLAELCRSGLLVAELLLSCRFVPAHDLLDPHIA